VREGIMERGWQICHEGNIHGFSGIAASGCGVLVQLLVQLGFARFKRISHAIRLVISQSRASGGFYRRGCAVSFRTVCTRNVTLASKPDGE
jgi:hypothetical protein